MFELGVKYQVNVRLRYRVSGPAVTWFIALHRDDLVFRDAFGEACETVAEKTDLIVLRGAPEV